MNVHSSTIHNSQKAWKQAKHPLTDEWEIVVYPYNGILLIHTMEYYSVIKRNEVLIHAQNG